MNNNNQPAALRNKINTTKNKTYKRTNNNIHWTSITTRTTATTTTAPTRLTISPLIIHLFAALLFHCCASSFGVHCIVALVTKGPHQRNSVVVRFSSQQQQQQQQFDRRQTKPNAHHFNYDQHDNHPHNYRYDDDAVVHSIRRSTALFAQHHRQIDSKTQCNTTAKRDFQTAPTQGRRMRSTATTDSSPIPSEAETPPTTTETTTTAMTFPESILRHDHYNGVTIHLEKCEEPSPKPDTSSSSSLSQQLLDPSTFAQCLGAALETWQRQGKKGIWIHVPIQYSNLIPIATATYQFEFHMVHDKRILILTKWLPIDRPNKLPLGPSHQVGVGCLVFCPWDATKILAVQEKTGPAASLKLWKLCTGLSDPGEDVHQAAVRELQEETGLIATCRGILLIRQSHSSSRAGIVRASSDLFFVCEMQLFLPDDFNPNNSIFQSCPEEIAAIQWMSVTDYCSQEPWQKSPINQEMNHVIWKAAQQHLRNATRNIKLSSSAATTTAIFPSSKDPLDHNHDDNNNTEDGQSMNDNIVVRGNDVYSNSNDNVDPNDITGTPTTTTADPATILLLKYQTLPLGFGSSQNSTIYYLEEEHQHGHQQPKQSLL